MVVVCRGGGEAFDGEDAFPVDVEAKEVSERKVEDDLAKGLELEAVDIPVLALVKGAEGCADVPV